MITLIETLLAENQYLLSWSERSELGTDSRFWNDFSRNGNCRPSGGLGLSKDCHHNLHEYLKLLLPCSW